MLGRLFILSLVAAALGGGAWYMDTQKKQKLLDEKRQALSFAQTNLNNTNRDLAKYQQQMGALREQSVALNALAASKTSLTEEIAQLESSRESVLLEFANDVQSVRLKYTSLLLPEVRMKDGALLKNVRFQTITDSEIRISHDFGVANTHPSNLPADLRERFRIDMLPMKEAAQLASANASVGTSTTGATAQLPSPAAPTPAPGVPAASPAPVAMAASQPAPPPGPSPAQLQTSIRELEQKMAAQAQTRATYQRQVQEYRKKDDASRIMGERPQYREVVPKLDAALRALEVTMAEMNTKIGDLKIQLENSKALPQ